MRRALLVLNIALVGCHGLRTAAPHHDAPGCRVADNLVDIGESDAAAPMVMLYAHHSFAPSEIIAIWADGAVVMTRDHRLVQGSIADAPAVAQRVARALARAPGYAEAGDVIDVPRAEIIARDGAHWRHAEMWGVSPGHDGDAPDGFRDAYRAILAATPAVLAPFQPAELGLSYEATDSREPALPWPDGIPEPPAERTTSTIDARFEPQLRGLVAAAHAQEPPHPVAFGGKQWLLAVSQRMRGQATTDRVWACVAVD